MLATKYAAALLASVVVLSVGCQRQGPSPEAVDAGGGTANVFGPGGLGRGAGSATGSAAEQRDDSGTTLRESDAGTPAEANVFGPGGLGRGTGAAAGGATGTGAGRDAGAAAGGVSAPTAGARDAGSIAPGAKGPKDPAACVDAWIREKGLNEYGDPKDTMYMGGTPLFDERTGRRMDRLEYISKKHPDVRAKCGLAAPQGPADR